MSFKLAKNLKNIQKISEILEKLLQIFVLKQDHDKLEQLMLAIFRLTS